MSKIQDKSRGEIPESIASIAGPVHGSVLGATVRHTKRRRGESEAEQDQGASGPGLATLAPGVLVNQYRLERELGRGAMGRVFLAWDRGLRRQVAIKFFDESAYDVGERFLVEARATARCRHRNSVAIYEVSEHQGRPFLVLEYLEGALLSTLLGHAPMTPARALDLIVPVVRALVCAHAAGIVHRDLKPDNILVTDEGTIKVLDFGIAKMVTSGGVPEAGGAHAVAPSMASLTSHGTVLGTLPYMAPEQWEHDRSLIDDRADIWAVGILLFEMVCGRHPLTPLSHQRLATTVTRMDEPMPAAADVAPPGHVPAALASIIDDCLRKPLAVRLGSARALLARLESVRLGPGPREAGSPYPGAAPFGEADAHRFFGRFWDVARATARIRGNPLVCVTGPAGAGKTSLVQAGVIPGLKASGEPWEVLALHPDRQPLTGLARLLVRLVDFGPGAGLASGDDEARARHLREQLAHAPDTLVALLHRCSQQRAGQVLLFVDHLERLCDPATDDRERAAFLACLSRLGEGAGTRVRAVVAMDQDALDRASAEHVFFRRLGRAMERLAPLDRAGLAQALIQPAAMRGYRFASPDAVEALLETLLTEPAPLAPLQRAATRLWAARDHDRRLLFDPTAGESP